MTSGELDQYRGQGPDPVLSADLTWRRWPATAGDDEWLAHLLTDEKRMHLASVEVIAPPGVPLSERPYSDSLLEWRRASWRSLEGFLASDRPESDARVIGLDDVLHAVPSDFVAWIGGALETHADALEELALSQRARPAERFSSYADDNTARARNQRAAAAWIAGHSIGEDHRKEVDLVAPIGELVAHRAAGSQSYEDVSAQMDLLASWAGSRAWIEDQLIYATVELARLKWEIAHSNSYKATAWARWMRALRRKCPESESWCGRLEHGIQQIGSSARERWHLLATHESDHRFQPPSRRGY